jgi:hypothetical protein
MCEKTFGGSRGGLFFLFELFSLKINKLSLKLNPIVPTNNRYKGFH